MVYFYLVFVLFGDRIGAGFGIVQDQAARTERNISVEDHL